VVRSHGWYDLPPFRYDVEKGELRLTALTNGRPAAFRFRRAKDGIAAEISPEAASGDCLRATATRVFSLGVDLRPFLDRASGDPALAWAVERGAGRFLRAPSLWEDTVKVLLTTNCSWAATRGMVRRAIDEFGSNGAFPGPEELARRREATLQRSIRAGYRTPALLALARGVASGRIDLSEWENERLDSEDVRERILALRGFGPYAAEGLLRLIGRHDYFAIDSWTRMKYRKLHPGRGAIERSIERRYRGYGKFQGLAFWLDLTRDWHETTTAFLTPGTEANL
jgi:N-glycosylase/DNA lyase